MSVQIFGGVIKNSIQPNFSQGFTHDGDMEAQAVDVRMSEITDKDEIFVCFEGMRGQNDNLYQLYFRLPRTVASALARAILSSNEWRVPGIRLQL